jgi:hypothetical protein
MRWFRSPRDYRSADQATLAHEGGINPWLDLDLSSRVPGADDVIRGFRYALEDGAWNAGSLLDRFHDRARTPGEACYLALALAEAIDPWAWRPQHRAGGGAAAPPPMAALVAQTLSAIAERWGDLVVAPARWVLHDTFPPRDLDLAGAALAERDRSLERTTPENLGVSCEAWRVPDVTEFRIGGRLHERFTSRDVTGRQTTTLRLPTGRVVAARTAELEACFAGHPAATIRAVPAAVSAGAPATAATPHPPRPRHLPRVVDRDDRGLG